MLHADTVCTQYTAYLHYCARAHVLPQSFARFVVDVLPHTRF